MKTLPFIIKKFALRRQPSPENGLVELIDKVTTPPDQSICDGDVPIPGYFVMSSATPNIDEAPQGDAPKTGSPEARQSELDNAAQGIKQISEHLYHVYKDQQKSPELVIVVHGYNMGLSAVQAWYKDIFHYINRHDEAIAAEKSQLFIGYRWPSENVELGRTLESLGALPPLPRDLLFAGGVAALVLLVLEVLELFLWKNIIPAFILGIPLFLLMLLGFMMMTLVVLRLVVYFRDRYRASNFGVLDLVELLRQIDWAMVQLKAEDIRGQTGCSEAEAEEQALKSWRSETRRVKLSFIGHSMGAFVVTNAVRILSDVFDSRSIQQQPPADVGSVFRLERLLLASPDIPILTIISSRANFLASSLRRFAESYLLSNEGDIALRIASTAANYIAFPSRTQSQGYRLGNVALSGNEYGIVNLNALDNELIEGKPLNEVILSGSKKVLDDLFITAERFQKKDGDATLNRLFKQQQGQQDDRVTVADFFTFFDCTDYKDIEFSVRTPDQRSEAMGILTRAQRRPSLGPWDYFLLTYDYITQKRDVHGGYFRGEFTQALLYRTAFLGFTGYLKTLHDDDDNAYDPHVALSKLHMACREKGIQGFLSPIRYRVDIQKQSLADTIRELLTAIAPELNKKVEKKVKDE